MSRITQAIELDEGYPNAWVLMGWIYWEESVWSWSADPEESMQQALDCVQKALSVDPNFPVAYSLLGSIHMVQGDSNLAIRRSPSASWSRQIESLRSSTYEPRSIDREIRAWK